MPRLYIIERPEPNAFATGRDPEHAAVAVTTGILEIMDERQLAGVLAHELSHVKNRDTLVGTIAATIGGAISFLAQMAQFQMIFGGGDDNRGGGLWRARRDHPGADRGADHPARRVARSRVRRGRVRAPPSPATRRALAQALERLEAANSQNGLRARLAQSLPGHADASPPPRRPRIRRSPTCTSSIRCRGEPRRPVLDPSPIPIARAAARSARRPQPMSARRRMSRRSRPVTRRRAAVVAPTHRSGWRQFGCRRRRPGIAVIGRHRLADIAAWFAGTRPARRGPGLVSGNVSPWPARHGLTGRRGSRWRGSRSGDARPRASPISGASRRRTNASRSRT